MVSGKIGRSTWNSHGRPTVVSGPPPRPPTPHPRRAQREKNSFSACRPGTFPDGKRSSAAAYPHHAWEAYKNRTTVVALATIHGARSGSQWALSIRRAYREPERAPSISHTREDAPRSSVIDVHRGHSLHAQRWQNWVRTPTSRVNISLDSLEIATKKRSSMLNDVICCWISPVPSPQPRQRRNSTPPDTIETTID